MERADTPVAVPPEFVLPGESDRSEILLSTVSLIIAVDRFRAWKSGFEFLLTVILKNEAAGQVWHTELLGDRRHTEPIIRMGLGNVKWGCASNYKGWMAAPDDSDQLTPILTRLSGAPPPSYQCSRWWVSPLPSKEGMWFAAQADQLELDYVSVPFFTDDIWEASWRERPLFDRRL